MRVEEQLRVIFIDFGVGKRMNKLPHEQGMKALIQLINRQEATCSERQHHWHEQLEVPIGAIGLIFSKAELNWMTVRADMLRDDLEDLLFRVLVHDEPRPLLSVG